MRELAYKLDSFCARHSRKGIPNLMLYIAVGNLIVYVLTLMDPTYKLFSLICFDRDAILQGQVWRAVTFLFASLGVPDAFGMILTLISLYFYFRIGQMAERQIGTLKFNLFYLGGALLMLLTGMLTGRYVSGDDLNLTLLLLFALLYSDAQILLLMIIPIKAKYVAWVYFVLMLTSCVRELSLIPLVPLIPLALFFWNQLPALLPDAWRWKLQRRAAASRAAPKAKPNPNWAAGYQSKSGKKPYHHKCTVCGRTDTEYPGLDFRYCSRCSGYRCYCMDHINDHAHIVETE